MSHNTTVVAVVSALAFAVPTTAHAVDSSPDPVGQGICSGGWRQNGYGCTAKHLGAGSVYKDGPGGTITVSKITAATLSTTVTGTGEVTVNRTSGSVRVANTSVGFRYWETSS